MLQQKVCVCVCVWGGGGGGADAFYQGTNQGSLKSICQTTDRIVM